MSLPFGSTRKFGGFATKPTQIMRSAIRKLISPSKPLHLKRRGMQFEALEPRLLLSADLTYGAASASALTLEVHNETVDSLTVPTFKIVDGTGDTVASQSVADTDNIVIIGSSEADQLTITDEAYAASAGSISFLGGDGDDTLINTNSDATWAITGTASGTIDSGVVFAEVENLVAGAGNDTLDYTAFTDPVTIDLEPDVPGDPQVASGFVSVSGFDNFLTFQAPVEADVTYEARPGGEALTLSVSGGTVELTDGAGEIVLSQALAETTSVSITGSASADQLTLAGDVLTSGLAVTFVGGGDTDTLVGSDSDGLWGITEDGAGTINGSSVVSFSGVERLIASPTAQDELDYSGYTGGDIPAVDLGSGTATGFSEASGFDSSVTGELSYVMAAGGEALTLSINSATGDLELSDSTGVVLSQALSATNSITITGSADSDQLTLGSDFNASDISITFVGGGDEDTLVGFGDDVWEIASDGAGNINSAVNFSGVENLTAGGTASELNYLGYAPVDLLAVNLDQGVASGFSSASNFGSVVATNLDYSIGAAADEDQLTLSLVGDRLRLTNAAGAVVASVTDSIVITGSASADQLTVTAEALASTAAISFIGGGVDDGDTLIGPDSGATWVVTANGEGSINGRVAFTGIENLSGGSGVDTLDFSSYSASAAAIDLESGTATGFTSVAGFEASFGNQGVASLNYVATAGGESLTVRVVEVESKDTVQLVNDDSGDVVASRLLENTDAVVIVGSADGDQLTVDNSFTGRGLTIDFAAGDGTDTLVGADGNAEWAVTTAGAGSIDSAIAFSGVENLTAGDGLNELSYLDFEDAGLVFVEVGAAPTPGSATGFGAVLNFDAAIVPQLNYQMVGNGTGTGEQLTLSLDGTEAELNAGLGDVVLRNGAGDVVLTQALALTESIAIFGSADADQLTLTPEIVASGLAISFDGGDNNDTLTGANSGGNWAITGNGVGAIDTRVTFSQVEFLSAGSGADTLDYSSYVGPEVSIDLAAGTADGFTGISGFEASVGNDGSMPLNYIVDAEGESLTLLIETVDSVKTLQILNDDSGDVVASQALLDTARIVIAGSASADQLTISDDVITSGLAISFVGGEGTDTIANESGDAEWAVTASTAGTINGIVTFSGVENLSAGTGADELSYAGYSGSVVVNNSLAQATGFNTVVGFDSIVGSDGVNDTFIGPLRSATWSLTGAAEGSVDGVAFSSFERLAADSDSLQVLDYSEYVLTAAAPVGVTVNLAATTATGFTGGILGFNGIFGTSQNDFLVGSDNDDLIVGGAGNDNIVGLGGNDLLSGGEGSDVVDAGAGALDVVNESQDTNFTLSSEDDTHTLTNTAGDTDTITDVESIELFGGAGDNVFVASAYSGSGLLLDGLGGNDSLTGSNQADILTGGDGRDTIDGLGGQDRLIESGSGRFVLSGNQNVATLDRGLGTDEVQSIELSGATAGQFSLEWNGELTRLIDFDADASEVEAALSGLDSIALGDVSVAETVTGWEVTFTGNLGGSETLPLLSGADNSTGVALSTSVAVAGVRVVESINNVELVTFRGGAGSNILDVSAFVTNATALDSVVLEGGAGDDAIIGGGNTQESLSGGDGADVIAANGGGGTIDGGSGIDIVQETATDANDENIILSNNSLRLDVTDTGTRAVTSTTTTTLVGIETAELTGSDGANTLDASAFNGLTDDAQIDALGALALNEGSLTESTEGDFTFASGDDIRITLETSNGSGAQDDFSVDFKLDLTADTTIDDLRAAIAGLSDDQLLLGYTAGNTALTLTNAGGSGGAIGVEDIGSSNLALLLGLRDGSFASGILTGTVLSARGVTLDGAAGDDILIGSSGDDLLIGGEGDDTIIAGGGYDTLEASGSGTFLLEESVTELVPPVVDQAVTLTDKLTITTQTSPTTTEVVTDIFVDVERVVLRGSSESGETLDASGFDGEVALHTGGGADTLIGNGSVNQFYATTQGVSGGQRVVITTNGGNDEVIIQTDDGRFGQAEIDLIDYQGGESAAIVLKEDGALSVDGDLTTRGQDIRLEADSIVIEEDVDIVSGLAAAAGDITLQARTITISENAQLLADSIETGGTGGDIRLKAEDLGADFSTGFYDFDVNTSTLTIADGAVLEGADIYLTSVAESGSYDFDIDLSDNPLSFLDPYLGEDNFVVSGIEALLGLVNTYIGAGSSVVGYVEGKAFNVGINITEATATIDVAAGAQIFASNNFSAEAKSVADATAKPDGYLFGIAYGEVDTTARVTIDGAITAAGDVDVTSNATNQVNVLARPSAVAGVGIAVAVSNINSTNTAHISSSAVINAGGDVNVTATTTDKTRTVAEILIEDDGKAGFATAIEVSTGQTNAWLDGTVRGYETDSVPGERDAVDNVSVAAKQVNELVDLGLTNVLSNDFLSKLIATDGEKTRNGVKATVQFGEIAGKVADAKRALGEKRIKETAKKAEAPDPVTSISKAIGQKVGSDWAKEKLDASTSNKYDAGFSFALLIDTNETDARIGSGIVGGDVADIDVEGALNITATVDNRFQINAKGSANNQASKETTQQSADFALALGISIADINNHADAVINAGSSVDAGGQIKVHAEALNNFSPKDYLDTQLNSVRSGLAGALATLNDKSATYMSDVDGVQSIEKDQTVEVAKEHEAGGVAGNHYKYLGDPDNIDLSTIDYSRSELWEDQGTGEAIGGISFLSDQQKTLEDSEVEVDGGVNSIFTSKTSGSVSGATDKDGKKSEAPKKAGVASVAVILQNHDVNAIIHDGVLINQNNAADDTGTKDVVVSAYSDIDNLNQVGALAGGLTTTKDGSAMAQILACSITRRQ